MDIDAVRHQIGMSFGPTDKLVFDQATVNAYGAASGEDGWIHTDPVRAATSRYGGTVVPAFLIMSKMGKLLRQVWSPPEGLKSTLHYGFDRVRIPSPLRVGERFFGTFELASVEEKRADMMLTTFQVKLECEGRDRPVIQAQWLVAFIY